MDGYLSLSADDGPGMNLIFLYDSTLNDWAMVGLGDSTGIEEPLTSGTTANLRSSYGYKPSRSWLTSRETSQVPSVSSIGTELTVVPESNWMCAGTNGFVYFFRSTSSNPTCNAGYWYIYSSSYRWSGISLGGGYYAPQASTGSVLYKVHNVAPEPDTTAPLVDHAAMKDLTLETAHSPSHL